MSHLSPDGVWYGGLTADALDQIVEEHFVGGQPVKEYSHKIIGPVPTSRRANYRLHG